MPRPARTVTQADSTRIANEFGRRLKAARLAAGLTQSQLAAGRYTKAYVSALENGLSRPSMVALDFFAERLGVNPTQLIKDSGPIWARLEADIALASGDWTSAVDGYASILETTTDPMLRAELLRGLAEGLTRLGRAREATSAAAEAIHLFRGLGREGDAALGEYWLASAQYQQENSDEAISLLQSILNRVRGGLKIEPDFEVRLLMALASVHARDGRHSEALAYLEQVRVAAETLDDRRRAVFLFDLAASYRETGDFEAAVRTGIAGLQLFKRVEAERETAELENDIAISYLALGNTVRATELASSSAATFERLGDDWWLAHVFDTQAAIELARGDATAAAADAAHAVEIGVRVGNSKAVVDALLSLGRAQRSLGDGPAALEAFERAISVARDTGKLGLVRQAARELADALAAAGQHERAFEVMREALG